ncbi:pyridoxamine 5'-phosphate oxidase family protein [Kitasatospora sp. NPDC004745]|uniref:pyridoxamine 5'-phosphate oxidase family protein n=1 Tax=Kitasatospora sp. NPDC004745 TaxID=3364019 RepID=UPI0036C3A70D
MTPPDRILTTVLRSYRTCEFATLGRDGTPLAWPTAAWIRPDGTVLVTTSPAFAQKALNVRRDGRVALLFSDPTGHDDARAPQVLISGTAVCPEEVRAGVADAEEYWRQMFVRQPHSRAFLTRPTRWLMDWYYLRLHITVTPGQVLTRSPLADLPPAAAPGASPSGPGIPETGLPGAAPLGAGLLAEFPTAVLGATAPGGAPVLARTRVVARPDGYQVFPAPDAPVLPGPASLLVHRHDDRLNGLRNVLVKGRLSLEGGTWLFAPTAVVDPAGAGRPGDQLRTLRTARAATARYLSRRGLPRPRVAWAEFATLARPVE